MTRPTGGAVRLDGESLVGRAPEDIVKVGIAHVPEGRRLFAGLTVRENLRVGAYASGGRADIDRAVELFPRLGERLDQVTGSMSGGEQQMCAIARGLMAAPKLIMIDELSLGLAPNLVEQILERLVGVTEAGAAVLLVDQDVDAALEAAGRGYVLENGRIVAGGDSASLLEDPRIREAYLGVA
jgi:branched-chain amino acid transport system ATP-binding protein